MKFCPNCGNKLQPGDRFCEKCGFQVAESQEEKPIVTEEPTPKLQQVEKKKPAVSPISAQSQPKNEKVAPVTPAVSKKGNKKANVSKDKLADLKNKVNMDKLQEQINKDPKKAGIFGGIALVIVIALGIAVHMIQLQPDHALVNKPYHMTLSIKTTSQGFFTGTHTETTTKSEVVYLDKHQGKAYAGDSVTSAKQAAKDKKAEEKKAEEERLYGTAGVPEKTKRTMVTADSADELLEKIRNVDWTQIKEQQRETVGGIINFGA